MVFEEVSDIESKIYAHAFDHWKFFHYPGLHQHHCSYEIPPSQPWEYSEQLTTS